MYSATDTAQLLDAASEARRDEKALAPISRVGSLLVVGPLLVQGRTGCDECAALRYGWLHDKNDAPPWERNIQAATLNAATAALIDSLNEALHRRSDGSLPGTVLFYTFDLETLHVQPRLLIPVPECPMCGSGLPEDEADATRVVLQHQGLGADGSFHAKPLTSAELATVYRDSLVGMVKPLGRIRDAVCPTVVADVRSEPDLHNAKLGVGRTFDYDSSIRVAILEGLERHAGMNPTGRRTVVRGSYAQLAPNALDPAALGLYAPAQYSNPSFPLQRYSPDLVFDWVWGTSLRSGRSILVPEQVAYYGRRRRGEGFVYEISNGCALGGSIEEAVLHGLLEVIERDAFLMAWYRRIPLPSYRLHGRTDTRIAALVDRIERTTGFHVTAKSIVLESGVPTVIAVASRDSSAPEGASFYCAAGAAADPEKAALGALCELSHVVQSGIEKAGTSEWAQHAASMAGDPDLVQTMEDHMSVNAHPLAFDQVKFLTEEVRTPDVQDASLRPASISEFLEQILERLLSHDLDVIVVDQTGPELEPFGLAACKVLVPGMLPMTFGHSVRRTHNLPRLQSEPRRHGFSTDTDLNPWPHPFP